MSCCSRFATFFLLMFLGLTVGCAGIGENRVAKAVGNYSRNRAYDFVDIFELSGVAGPSARVDVKYGLGMVGFTIPPTEARATLLRFGQRYMGVIESERFQYGMLPFPVSLVTWIPLTFFYSDVHPEGVSLFFLGMLHPTGWEWEKEHWHRTGAGLSEHDWESNVLRAAFFFFESDSGKEGLRYPDKSTPRLFDRAFPIGTELQIGLGLRARVYPAEAIDFVIGIFGLDILKDDLGCYPSQ